MNRRFQFASGDSLPRWCAWLLAALLVLNLLRVLVS